MCIRHNAKNIHMLHFHYANNDLFFYFFDFRVKCFQIHQRVSIEMVMTLSKIEGNKNDEGV